MVREEELVDELASFGLDDRSAKVYYHLSRLGPSTASEIAQASGVQRTEVYRVMEDLEDHGFVDKTLERPRKYVPHEIEEALDEKLKERQRELEALEDASHTLTDEWPRRNHEMEGRQERFSVHQGRSQIRGLLERMVDHAENEILLATLKRGMARLDTMEILDRVADRASDEIAVRALTEITENNTGIVEQLDEVGEVRHVELPSYAQLVIVDSSEIALFVSLDPLVSTQGTGETVLWLNARDFILGQKALFDALWSNGIEKDPRLEELRTGEPSDRVEVVRGRWMRYDRLKEMLHRARSSARLLLPRDDIRRLEKAGLARTLERGVEQGVDVEIVAPEDPSLDGVDVLEIEEDPRMALVTVDGSEALMASGVQREPGSMASEVEWAVWVTVPEWVDHVDEQIGRRLEPSVPAAE